MDDYIYNTPHQPIPSFDLKAMNAKMKEWRDSQVYTLSDGTIHKMYCQCGRLRSIQRFGFAPELIALVCDYCLTHPTMNEVMNES